MGVLACSHYLLIFSYLGRPQVILFNYIEVKCVANHPIMLLIRDYYVIALMDLFLVLRELFHFVTVSHWHHHMLFIRCIDCIQTTVLWISLHSWSLPPRVISAIVLKLLNI